MYSALSNQDKKFRSEYQTSSLCRKTIKNYVTADLTTLDKNFVARNKYIKIIFVKNESFAVIIGSFRVEE